MSIFVFFLIKFLIWFDNVTDNWIERTIFFYNGFFLVIIIILRIAVPYLTIQLFFAPVEKKLSHIEQWNDKILQWFWNSSKKHYLICMSRNFKAYNLNFFHPRIFDYVYVMFDIALHSEKLEILVNFGKPLGLRRVFLASFWKTLVPRRVPSRDVL